MRDDFLTADWAQNHDRTTETIGALFATLAASFEKLNRYQFDAPWRHDATTQRGAAAACTNR